MIPFWEGFEKRAGDKANLWADTRGSMRKVAGYEFQIKSYSASPDRVLAEKKRVDSLLSGEDLDAYDRAEENMNKTFKTKIHTPKDKGANLLFSAEDWVNTHTYFGHDEGVKGDTVLSKSKARALLKRIKSELPLTARKAAEYYTSNERTTHVPKKGLLNRLHGVTEKHIAPLQESHVEAWKEPGKRFISGLEKAIKHKGSRSISIDWS